MSDNSPYHFDIGSMEWLKAACEWKVPGPTIRRIKEDGIQVARYETICSRKGCKRGVKKGDFVRVIRKSSHLWNFCQACLDNAVRESQQ